MTGQLHEINPMPVGKERYGDETLCTHPYAKKLGTTTSEGDNVLGQFRVALWLNINCPDCKTTRVLHKHTPKKVIGEDIAEEWEICTGCGEEV
jgi:ribosomal protein S27E